MATVDERVHCNGIGMRDKKDWDGEYPYFEPTRAGFIVHLSVKSDLPGVFTDLERAKKGHARYLGAIYEADLRIAEAKKAKKAKKKGK